MRKYIFILSIGIIPIFTNAQDVNIGGTIYQSKNAQTIDGKAFYNFIYLKDTTQPNNLYQEKFELDFGKTASLFSSYEWKENDSAMAAQMQQQFAAAPDPNHVAVTLHGKSASRDAFYTDISAVPVVYNFQYVSSALFYVNDAQQKIDWQIEDSTKNIQDYLCQKAVGKSHGRTYTAWFCADIPYGFGPRKLNGLPGLILEACDEKRDVVFTLDHVAMSAQDAIGIPDDAMKATQPDIDKATEAFKKNPRAFIEANSRIGHSISDPFANFDASKIKTLSIIKDNGNGSSSKPLKENNPIDLE